MKFTDFSQFASTVEYKLMSKKAQTAIVNLALESIYPDDEMLEDFLLLDSGFLTKEEFIELSLKKIGIKK